MRRGGKPAKAKVEIKLPVARKSPEEESSGVGDLEKRLAEALEQQTATSEILRVISGSPTELAPVFDAILRSAVRLCDAVHGVAYRYDGAMIHVMAHHQYTPEALAALHAAFPSAPGLQTATNEAILRRVVVHVPDAAEDPSHPSGQEIARRLGYRTLISVPMIREGDAIGTITVARRERRLFSDSQIALLQTFADQAVIAIENVRLFTELQEKNRALTQAHAQVTESLEQQTATSEILRVISASPTDLTPVLNTVVQSAARFCGSEDASLFQLDGDTLRQDANHGPVGDIAGFRVPVVRGTVGGRTVLERRAVHVADIQAEVEEFPEASAIARRVGHRTILSVPLLREGTPIGVLQLRRAEVNPFTDKQIALLQTFADQAVIAIENVRLFNETKEALEQQRASSEILGVISSSPTNVQPVFDVIVQSAVRLCGGLHSNVYRVENGLIHLVAHHNFSPAALEHLQRRFPMPVSQGEGLASRVIREGIPVYVHDAQTDPEVTEMTRRTARALGARSVLSVPMLRDRVGIGVIVVSRAEVKPFSDKEIALIRTFADQAVIAIENVRLFTELQEKNQALTEAHAQVSESLEQQTATSEILGVISRSPTDVQPVFDTIVSSAVRLCDGLYSALHPFDGELIHLVAQHNFTPEALEAAHRIFPARPTRALLPGRAILERAVVQIRDVEIDPEHQSDQELTRAVGWRSGLFVPMLREGAPIGVIVVARAEPGPFSDNEIKLLKTFADQAVIAIENVRLFKELEARNRDLTEALEQQTATSEILRVISASPTDVRPVMDAIAENAARLCGEGDASRAGSTVWQLEGSSMRVVASYGVPRSRAIRDAVPLTRGFVSGRVVIDREIVHIRDLAAEGDDFAEVKAVQLTQGIRTLLGVPLLREGTSLGAIVIRRFEVRPFTDKQIALVKTFADQAVIAIENVRLFKELQERNKDLTEALDRQTVTAEILRVISQSQTAVQPVFDTIVQSAARLCNAANAGVFLTDGRTLDLPANYGSSSPEALATIRAQYPRPLDQETTAGVAILTRSVVHVPDIEAPSAADVYTRRVGQLLGVRSMVAVPMLRKGEVVGAINLSRREPGRFSDAEVELLKTFADQAVIAIENVRLFKELAARNSELTEALDQQTATSEILRVISRSQTDVQPVFDTILSSAVRLCDGLFGALYRFDGELMYQVAQHNYGPEALAEARRAFPARPSRALSGGRAILESAVVNLPDIQLDPEYQQAIARAAGARSILAVPLLREGAVTGAIAVARAQPGSFSDNQVELLQTFADQAVIAIENVRLLSELQARTQELTRSVEQLTALGDVGRTLSSTLDLDAVLQTIVTRASQLAGTDACSVFEYDEATETFHLRATHNLDEEVVALARRTPTRKGEGVQGRMAMTRQPVQVPDIAEGDAYRGPLRDILLRTGTRAVLAIPMLREDELIGGLTVARKTPGEFSPEVIELLKTFATQSALAIQNARLFREIADKSRQLEAASQHKSEFLANMSHELRTPLNAIIGFSEVLAEGMFGEVNEKQTEYLRDILESGQHLLSLINDILDLSKIEAGRMELELTDFDLPQAISNALTLVRGRAGRRGIALHQAVDERLGPIRGDERKIKQVLLNLLSNALKFTPEGGRVDVRASVVDAVAEVSVTDTGVGIAPEDQEAVFEEFRQVGTADKKVEGTGLGLALSRKFIELHGGRIWLKSQVGVGSTFTFTLPLTIDQRHQTASPPEGSSG